MNVFDEGDLVFLKCDTRPCALMVIARAGKDKCECLHMKDGKVLLNVIPNVALIGVKDANK